MRITQTKVFAMGRRVVQFLTDHASVLGTLNSTAARTELDTLMQTMDSNGNALENGKGVAAAGAASIRAARTALINTQMQPVASIARAHLANVPDLTALRMPMNGVASSKLVLAANAMATQAKSQSQVFTDNGLPATFADTLLSAAATVRTAIDARAATLAENAAAAAALAASASRVHAVVGILHAHVRVLLANNPDLLAEWKSLKRVGQKAQKAPKAQNTSAPQTTTATTASSTAASGPAAKTAPAAAPAVSPAATPAVSPATTPAVTPAVTPVQAAPVPA